MPRNTREIITRDRSPEIRKYRDELIQDLYYKYKYTLGEIEESFTGLNTTQSIWKIIKKKGQ